MGRAAAAGAGVRTRGTLPAATAGGLLVLAGLLVPRVAVGTGADVLPTVRAAPCAEGPEYYRIELVTTRRVLGTGRAGGTADVSFGSSPFGVSLGRDGSYLYELRIEVHGLPGPKGGAYVAWVSTPELDRIERLGPVVPGQALEGEVRWNKFLVVVSLEGEAADEEAARWSGPVVLRGMSRSGAMHTMLGHGPFQTGDCAAIGFQ